MLLMDDTMELAGFSIGQATHFSIDGQVTALYGLNGSGKTRVLRAVESALLGRHPDPAGLAVARSNAPLHDVHVRLRPEGSRGGWGLPVLRAAVRRAALELDPPESMIDLSDPEALLDLRLADKAVELMDRATDRDDRDEIEVLVHRYLAHWRGLVREGLQLGCVTFQAVGTPQNPAWEAFVSLPILGAGSEMLAELEARVERLQLRGAQMRATSDEERARASQPRDRLREQLDWGVPLEADTWRYIRRDLGTPAPAQVPIFRLGRVVVEPIPPEDVDMPGWRSVPAPDVAPGSPLGAIVGLAAPTADVDSLTIQDMADYTGLAGGWGIFSSGTDLEPDALDHLRAIEELATRLYRCVFADGWELIFDLGNPEFWFRGFGPSWYAGGTHLDALASSKQRWAKVAIQLALDVVAVSDGRDSEIEQHQRSHALGPAPRHRPIYFIYDEPELGLHRLLEHRLGDALVEVGRITGAAVLVATHSPDLLKSPLVNAAHVSELSGGGIAVRNLALSVVDSDARASAASQLGLSHGDLWALSRLVVFVEGLHDEWIFKCLLKEDLDESLAAVLPIHGGTRLRSLADASMIMDGTEAAVLVVLDEMTASDGQRHLDGIKGALMSGDTQLAEQLLLDLRAEKGDSYLYVHQLIAAAKDRGSLQRISIHGLAYPDVICYLPPDLVLDQPKDWKELIAAWRHEAGEKEPKNLKGWLKTNGHLPQDAGEIDRRIRAAAAQARSAELNIPADLVQLGLRIREMSLQN